jgi:hypothetical protein
MVDDVLDVVSGLLLSWATDNANGRPGLEVAPTLMCQPFRLRDTLDTGLGREHVIEVHV